MAPIGHCTAAGNVILALEYGPVARPQRHEERLILSSTQGRRPGRSPRAARSREAVDRQTMLLRRAIGLGAAVVVVILLRGRDQRLPGQPQGPRLRGLRRRTCVPSSSGSSEISDQLFDAALPAQARGRARRPDRGQRPARGRRAAGRARAGHRPSRRAERRQRLARRGARVPRGRDRAHRRAAAGGARRRAGQPRRDRLDRRPDAGVPGQRRDLPRSARSPS